MPREKTWVVAPSTHSSCPLPYSCLTVQDDPTVLLGCWGHVPMAGRMSGAQAMSVLQGWEVTPAGATVLLVFGVGSPRYSKPHQD